jgi:hypothetical protein
LRNVVTLFHYIGKERAWRESQGRSKGFETLDARKPIVAVGATEPLAEHMMVADFFHGIDVFTTVIPTLVLPKHGGLFSNLFQRVCRRRMRPSCKLSRINTRYSNLL